MGEQDSFDELPALASALAIVTDDPELARVRAATEARLLGLPLQSTRIGRFAVLERLGAGGMGVVYAAFDPQLDRKVAIKVLFGRAGEAVRLVAEARAMARLAHPNVAHVYEVGEHDGHVFLAMEYIRGQTLRAWWSARRRTWREILAVCTDAGRGLEAAHAHGIVHRDFKPDNVMVADDGRAVVLDFGLARQAEEPTQRDAAAVRTRGPDTATHPNAGTPAYMPPEQLRGERVDAQGDQFAFCASVWEAMTGALPFGPDRIGALLLDEEPAPLRAPPRDTMPRWVERVLRRGLQTRDRFDSMTELLAALSRDPRRVWARRLALTSIVAGMGAAFWVGSLSHGGAPSTDPCTGGAAVLQEAWPAADRDVAFARLWTLSPSYGPTLVPRAIDAVADFDTRWTAAHRDACLAHSRGEQSAALLDRRMACLHRGRTSLHTLGALLSDLDTNALPNLALMVDSLPDPDRCSDLTALAIGVDPPPPEARSVAERVAVAAMLMQASRLDDAEAEIDAVIAEARALDHAPLLAEALLARGKILIDAKRRDEAAAPLRESVDLALTSGADEIAVEAWGQLEWVVGTGGAQLRERPLDGRSVILQLAERRPYSASTMSLYNNLSGVDPYARNPELARAALERSIAIAEHLGPSADRGRAAALGNLAPLLDDPEARQRTYAEAVARWTAVAGPDHPRTLRARGIWAADLSDLHASANELESICATLRRDHHALPGVVSSCQRQLSLAYELIGDTERCETATRRWVESARPGETEMAHAYAAVRYGAPEDAVRILEAMVARYEAMTDRTFWEDYGLGEAQLLLGRAYRMLGRDDADALIEQATRRLEGAPGRPLTVVERRLIQMARAVVHGTLPGAHRH